MFLSRGHVWRAGSQGKPANVVLWHHIKGSFKNIRQRGVNVTLESFVSHRRLQDSAVGIRIQLCFQLRVEENISKNGVHATNQEIKCHI